MLYKKNIVYLQQNQREIWFYWCISWLFRTWLKRPRKSFWNSSIYEAKGKPRKWFPAWRISYAHALAWLHSYMLGRGFIFSRSAPLVKCIGMATPFFCTLTLHSLSTWWNNYKLKTNLLYHLLNNYNYEKISNKNGFICIPFCNVYNL